MSNLPTFAESVEFFFFKQKKKKKEARFILGALARHQMSTARGAVTIVSTHT